MSTTMLSSLSDKERVIQELKDFYVPYRKSLKLPSDATFGLEIEFKMPDYNWKYRSNFSCQDIAAMTFMEEHNYNGIWDVCPEENDHIEIVSPILIDESKTWKDLHNILNNIKENGAYYSGECGAHIHVGRHLLGNNIESWLIFFKTWAIFEDIIFRFTNGENYSKRTNFDDKSKSTRELFIDLIDRYTSSNGEMQSLLLDKKHCINIEQTYVDDMASLNEKFENNIENTIEFRCPNGTLNKVIWQNNVSFFTKFLLACKSENYDAELVDHLYRKVINKDKLEDDNLAFILVDLIFNSDFDKYCFLRQYYKDFDNPSKEDNMLKSKPFWK